MDVLVIFDNCTGIDTNVKSSTENHTPQQHEIVSSLLWQVWHLPRELGDNVIHQFTQLCLAQLNVMSCVYLVCS